ncbi:hypothetical protein [Sphingopyxis yananensis]|uniref:hypothetical protein n=1 Tax=Sphingopyxis yananensis TaxID=2886687 RepID=UPI001D0F4E12|nr:hypothetical protein [Sphingopyxis yananensis]MCC2602241.1 hypothetical protein [Sphingopyxis yananensis]
MAFTSEFYFERAVESARDAKAASLPNVRDRCLRAEKAWRTMGERLRDSEKNRANREDRTPSGPELSA